VKLQPPEFASSKNTAQRLAGDHPLQQRLHATGLSCVYSQIWVDEGIGWRDGEHRGNQSAGVPPWFRKSGRR
jgi:hypothetical protein